MSVHPEWSSTWPTWEGYCELHGQSLPCRVCSTVVQPECIPTSWPPSPPTIFDPWMPGAPSPAPTLPLVPGATIPLIGYRFLPHNCEHCFCEYHDTTDHQECCNCGMQRKYA